MTETEKLTLPPTLSHQGRGEYNFFENSNFGFVSRFDIRIWNLMN